MAGSVERRNLKKLQDNVQSLLSEEEKYYFSYALKDYKTYKSIEKLVRSLLTCLNSPEKRQLLKDVRNFVLPSQQRKFDTLLEECGVSKTNTREVLNFPTGGPHAATTSPKYRVVSLINDKINNIDLGFRVCGGKEIDSGIYVASVIENSPSFNAGLCRNNLLIEVNGISLQNISLKSAANLLASLSKLKIVAKEDTRADILDKTESINPW